jgi:hypothetical protein
MLEIAPLKLTAPQLVRYQLNQLCCAVMTAGLRAGDSALLAGKTVAWPLWWELEAINLSLALFGGAYAEQLNGVTACLARRMRTFGRGRTISEVDYEGRGIGRKLLS